MCEHDVGDGNLAQVSTRPANDGGVDDRRVSEQLALDLRWRDRVAAHLDEFLQPVESVKVTGVVESAEVAGVQPAVSVDRRGGLGDAAEVLAHDLRAAQPQLACLIRREPHAGSGLDDDGLVVREQTPDRAPHRRISGRSVAP